jgi:hypothetical protein
VIEESEHQEDGEEPLSSEESDATPTETEEPEGEEPESVAEALEQAGRDVSTLAVRELQLAAARHRPTVRRVLRDIVAVLAIALALLTAFAFLNVAADRALSSVMPDWAAALVLAAAWIALGALLFAFLLRRGERAAGARRWRVALAADPATSVALCEQARDDARDAMRASLGRLTDALTSAAGEQLAQAASGVAEGVVDAGEDILDAADDVADAIEEALPGGGVVNKALDLALVPGRLAIRISRTIFVRGERSAGN